MSLDTYTNLKAELADWLNRSDLTTVIDTFIDLAEAKMKRDIRKWTVYSAAYSVSAARVAAPTDLSVLRSIRFVSGSPTLDRPLRVGTIEMVNERKARNAGSTGRPTDVAVVDGYLYFGPEPDQTYTAEIFYFSTLTPLSGSVASNSVLSEAPDIYLYGALAEAEPYLEHDERAPMWKAKYEEAVASLNAKRDEDEFSASLHSARLPVVFD
jgi:hypothetical protein